jgi:hypothetical protein
MIDQSETEHIYTNAYVPEHLVDYVGAISGAEPFLFEQYLCYKRDETLIFIGYPLGVPFDHKQMKSSLEEAAKDLKPRNVALVAPIIGLSRVKPIQRSADSYYRLDIDGFQAPSNVQNMVRGASRELSVETGKEWSKEHGALVTEFLASHEVSEETERIFTRIPEYIASTTTALLLSARNHEGTLIAFDIADYGSKDYAFYMFNFASREHYVAGASDLLLHQLITIAREKGKCFVNLGLTINEGITFFKQKWGGVPFLNHEFILYETSRAGIIESLLGRL